MITGYLTRQQRGKKMTTAMKTISGLHYIAMMSVIVGFITYDHVFINQLFDKTVRSRISYGFRDLSYILFAAGLLNPSFMRLRVNRFVKLCIISFVVVIIFKIYAHFWNIPTSHEDYLSHVNNIATSIIQWFSFTIVIVCGLWQLKLKSGLSI